MAETAQQEPGPVARFVGVFTSPSATFASIARRPRKDWLLPAGLILVLALAGALLIPPKIDADAEADRMISKLEEQREIPADQEEAIRERYASGVKGAGRFFGLLGALLPLVVVPGLYHGIAAAFGKQTTYGRVLTAYGFVQAVQVVKGLLLLGVASAKETIAIREIPTLVKSSVGAFLPESTPAALRSIAASIDVFEIWALALGVIALTKVTRFKTGGAAVVVVGLWVLYVLLGAAFATVGAAFGGG
jgi:hypothetical protein